MTWISCQGPTKTKARNPFFPAFQGTNMDLEGYVALGCPLQGQTSENLAAERLKRMAGLAKKDASSCSSKFESIPRSLRALTAHPVWVI